MPIESSESIKIGLGKVIATHEIVVGKEKVSLKLQQYSSVAFMLERQAENREGPLTIQSIDIGDARRFNEFIESDPYADQLRFAYKGLAARFNSAYDPEGLRDYVVPSSINGCMHEIELLRAARTTCRALATHNFVYHWVDGRDLGGANTTHTLLVGGPAAWAQQYMHNLWYLNDPGIHYARRNAMPVRGSLLPANRDDHWLAKAAQSHGFKSNVFFPAHLRASNLFGLLHVSSGQSEPVGENEIWEDRERLRNVAMELLDWRVLRNREVASAAYCLEAREVTALKVLACGGTTKHVSAELRISTLIVRKLFRDINRKLNCTHIKTSLAKARTLGLLG
jgi:hypothetical protein